MRRPGVVTVANEKVPITTVLSMLGVEVFDGSNRKIRCPFGKVYHSDGGIDPAMRVYPETNSCYCFSCTQYFTPVGIASQALDMGLRDTAEMLLDRIGHRPLDPVKAWEQASKYEPAPDTAMLAEALKTYCRRISPDWPARQFEPEISYLLRRCLGLLDQVKTGKGAVLWLTLCKRVMHRSLHPDVLSPS